MASTFPITTPHYEHDVANGIHLVLLKRFEKTLALSHKVLRRTDPANVQFMSSAVQRLYLAFKDLKPLIADQCVSNTEVRIRDIADALSEIRCQNMAILALEEVTPQAPRQLAQTIQQFIETRKQIRRKSRQTLERVLVSLEENVLSGQFEKTGTPGAPQPGVVRRRRSAGSLKNVATSIIQSHLSEFEKCSTLLNECPQGMSVVALDRATQRLLYAIELFADCSTSDVRLFSTSLTNLQRALTKVSDCDTLIKEIRRQILEAKKTGPQGTKRTFVVLFAQFSEVRNFHFDESLAFWNAWESDHLSSQLRKTITRSI